MKFLDGQSDKTVRLERILGIGGEGIVLSDEMTTKEHHYKKGWEEKKGREVAVKFVKFEKDEDEDFEGPDEKSPGSRPGYPGDIDENGKYVKSQYLERLKKLGDYAVATLRQGGYNRPYIDFGVSKINEKYLYVIGEWKVLK